MGADDGAATEPPLTVELLADLQAGLLDDDTAARIRQRVRGDADAAQTLAALTKVRDDVAALGTDASCAEDVSPDVVARVRAALRSAAPVGPAAHAVRPAIRPARVIAAVAGVAAVATAVVLGTFALISAPASAPSSPATAQHITVSRAPTTIPLSDPQILALLDRQPDYGPLADPQRRASCLSGLGYPASVPVLAAQPLEVSGHAAVLFVLPGDPPGAMAALAVAPTCSSVDTGLLADRLVQRP